MASLKVNPDEALKKHILYGFWPEQQGSFNFDLYFSRSYHGTCQSLFEGLPPTELESMTVQTHEDLRKIITIVRSVMSRNSSCTRGQIRDALVHTPRITDVLVERVNNSINVALRAWLTMNIREDYFAQAEDTIQWDETTGFQDFISSQFKGPKNKATSRESDIVLDSQFTAANMRDYCQIKTKLTFNLKQHLSFVSSRGQKILLVYPLASCLRAHGNRYALDYSTPFTVFSRVTRPVDGLWA